MTPSITKALLVLAGAVCIGLSFVPAMAASAGALTTTGIALLTAGGVTIHDSGHVEVAGVSAKVLAPKPEAKS